MQTYKFKDITGWVFITPRLAGWCAWKGRKRDFENLTPYMSGSEPNESIYSCAGLCAERSKNAARATAKYAASRAVATIFIGIKFAGPKHAGP